MTKGIHIVNLKKQKKSICHQASKIHSPTRIYFIYE